MSLQKIDTSLPAAGICTECENDTFHVIVVKLVEKTAVIKIRCAMCGKETSADAFN